MSWSTCTRLLFLKLAASAGWRSSQYVYLSILPPEQLASIVVDKPGSIELSSSSKQGNYFTDAITFVRLEEKGLEQKNIFHINFPIKNIKII